MNLETESPRYKSTNINVGRILCISAITRQIPYSSFAR